MDGGSEYCSRSILHQWGWKMCEEFCEPLEVDMKPGVHYPEETDCNYKLMMQSLANLNIRRKIPQVSEQYSSVVSMTGVSTDIFICIDLRTSHVYTCSYRQIIY